MFKLRTLVFKYTILKHHINNMPNRCVAKPHKFPEGTYPSRVLLPFKSIRAFYWNEFAHNLLLCSTPVARLVLFDTYKYIVYFNWNIWHYLYLNVCYCLCVVKICKLGEYIIIFSFVRERVTSLSRFRRFPKIFACNQ